MRVAALSLLVLLATISVTVASTVGMEPAGVREIAATADVCEIPPRFILRMTRGRIPGRSEDIAVVPAGSNYLGSFATTSHSGAADYLQRVPLVWYGPELTSAGRVRDRVTLADVYPTMGRLTGVDLDPRAGNDLSRVALADEEPPRLVVVIVWDGVGVNVLRRWPHSWPNLARLERRGTSFARATVGSSPSITPATHSTLGTGAFPQQHEVTGIQYRSDADTIDVSFERRDPSILALSTFGDQIDAALGNAPKVGLVGWRSWHLGMLGHGAGIDGGDRDDLALIGYGDRISGRRPEFRLPPHLADFPGLERHLAMADAADGERDRRWFGHPLADDQDNPGWVSYQQAALRTMIARGRYGADEVTDLLFVNFKATDRVGHLYNMDSLEMESVLHSQDAALGRLVSLLDRRVEDYVVVVTADHGHTPSPERSGAWAIHQRELEDDLDRHFGVGEGNTLTQAMTAVGLFVDRQVMDERAITEQAIADFLSGYTIRENWGGRTLPTGYADRGGEAVFSAAFPARVLDEGLPCGRRIGEDA